MKGYFPGKSFFICVSESFLGGGYGEPKSTGSVGNICTLCSPFTLSQCTDACNIKPHLEASSDWLVSISHDGTRWINVCKRKKRRENEGVIEWRGGLRAASGLVCSSVLNCQSIILSCVKAIFHFCLCQSLLNPFIPFFVLLFFLFYKSQCNKASS